MVDFKIQVDEDEQGSPEAHSAAPASKAQKASKRSSKPQVNLSKKGTIFMIVGLVAIALVGGFLFQMNKIENLKQENARLADPQQSAQAEADQIKNEVSQLIELPDETPTVATVVDVEKLKGQEFFANAQNGDRVLLFAETKKAVLYRPETKKIIEVAPINIGEQEGTTAGESTSQPAEN